MAKLLFRRTKKVWGTGVLLWLIVGAFGIVAMLEEPRRGDFSQSSTRAWWNFANEAVDRLWPYG